MEAFVEVITNAVKAMKGQGGLQISSSLESNQVKVWFTDNGCGIPSRVGDRIFDLFCTVDTDGRPMTALNRGYGLWWVRTFLMQYGAAIDYESEASKGTTFFILLPTKGGTDERRENPSH